MNMRDWLYGVCAVFLLSTAASGAKLERSGNELLWGDSDFSVTFDSKTGTWKKLVVGGKEVLATKRTKVPFDLALTRNGKMLSGDVTYTLADIKQPNQDSLILMITAGKITAECRYKLFPQEKMVSQVFTITNNDNETFPIYRFETALPRIKFGEQSYYFCPAVFPRSGKKTLHDLSAGHVVQNWRDPNATIIQLSPNQTVMTAINRNHHYSDISRTAITEVPNGINLVHTVESAGYLKPREPWEIGDFYCQVQNNDGDTALTRIHQWMKNIGMTIPRDRNEKSKFARLYSFHPGQPGHPFQDWGGFLPSTAQLPRIKSLNINTVWILPVESECPYIPDDFYKMANGIGTAEEYHAMVKRAQKLGMKVWQDIVPHGGRNSCERAQKHPDWLIRDETGNVPRVRSFDYNNPDWQKYLGEVVTFYTKTYGLDGWRIDTAGFSDKPNWSKTIPYTRGSWAMGMGGFGMMNVIRRNALKENPEAIILAECDGSVYGTAADIVYDFPLCRNVFKSIRTLSPAVFVRELSTWLNEQNYAELEDLVRLRYIESHDEPKAELLYGPEPVRAGMALVSWIHGVPMIYKEMEDGHSEIFGRIMKLRQLVPVLSTGIADYRSCRSSAGVFACLRFDKNSIAIPVINFNPDRVKAKVTIPAKYFPCGTLSDRDSTSVVDQWSTDSVPLKRNGNNIVAEVELSGYGFALLTPGTQILCPVMEKKHADGLLTVKATLTSNEKFTAVGATEGLNSYRLAQDNMLIFRIDGDGEDIYWRAVSANGIQQDKFRTRHPFYNSMLNNMYSLPSGHNVLWNSVHNPFGFTEKEAEILFTSAKGAVRFSFPETDRPAGVFLIDRLGSDHAPHLVIVKNIPDTPLAASGEIVTCRISKDFSAVPEKTVSGDKRLSRIAGGWLFDNDEIRLRIASNGTLVSAWQKISGKWEKVAENLRVEMHGGYINGSGVYTSENELETFQLFSKSTDGKLELCFFGRPRGHHYYQTLPPNTLNYFISYTLDDSAGFGLQCGVRPVIPPPNKTMSLAVSGKLNIPYSLISGNNSLLNGRDGIISYKWFDGKVPEKDFGLWQWFSIVIGKTAIIPPAKVAGRKASPFSAGLLDPSFEFDYLGAFPDIVQMYCYALPWQMPFGSTTVTDFVKDGKRAVRLTLTGKEEQFMKQRLTRASMKSGERWKLSVWCRAQELVNSRIRVQLLTPSYRWENNRNFLSLDIPGGSWEYRQFEIEFTVPEKQENWEIWLGGKADSGIVWFDDLRLEKVR